MRSITGPWRFLLLALLCIAVSCSSTSVPEVSLEPDHNALEVLGDIAHARRFSVGDLESLGTETVAWEFRDQRFEYRGVSVDRILRTCGFDAGPGGAALPVASRRPGWRKVLVAEATDGFVAIFTCAEVSEEMGATRAFVAFGKDGGPLDSNEGQLRLVVTTDLKGSRSVRQLVRLRVLDLSPLVAGYSTAGR